MENEPYKKNIGILPVDGWHVFMAAALFAKYYALKNVNDYQKYSKNIKIHVNFYKSDEGSIEINI